MPAPRHVDTPRELLAALDFVDPARVAAARAEAVARPIAYALGSGEADEVALYAGLKPLIRQVLPLSQLSAARARFEALGLAIGVSEHRVDLRSTAGTVLFVGRDPRHVREAVLCEAMPDHDHELGKLLGYPRCCVEAYLEIPPPKRNIDAFARAAAASGGVFTPRLNTVDLAVFHYISWLPCSFSCAISTAFADAVAHHIARKHARFLASARGAAARAPRESCPPGCRHERFVAAIDAAHAAHRLVLFDDVQVSIAGAIDGGVVRVDHAWPTARDRHPAATIADEDLEAAARVVALIEAAGTVSIVDGVIHAGDAAVLHAEGALLLPFGARPGPC
ncbi:MAG: hypothetical protein ABJE95_16725 [Byssovorax sp.]